MMKKILVIDDDPDICLLLQRFLKRHDFEVVAVNSGTSGLAALEKEAFDVVLTDFRLGDMEGSAVLQSIKAQSPTLPVIVITGYSDIRMAVNVIKLGAFDYITKPLFPDEILLTIKRALDAPKQVITEFSSENEEINKAEIPPPSVIPSGVSAVSGAKKMSNGYVSGDSVQASALYRQVSLVAPTNYSVIIYGESGSGKESIAKMIHDQSKRRKQPFVAMDCGAISKDLANSELFGHEKGAFTGALATKIGHFELANGGTIFLDEVSNLTYDVQIALLRIVQERKMKRIGSTKEIDLDVRIIVASNERLSEAVRRGKFREDLYHRFNEFSIDVPPLRERKDDILLLANHFLKETCQELGKHINGLSDAVAHIFLNYTWFGNIRELKNVIKRAALLTDTPYVQTTSLPFEIVNFQRLQFDEPEAIPFTNSQNNDIRLANDSAEIKPAPISVPIEISEPKIKTGESLKKIAAEAEYELILKTLQDVRYNKSKAADILGIDRKTLYNKLKNFNIDI